MSLSMGIFTFVNLWWITLFFVLAWSAKPETDPSQLDYVAAPKALIWKKKLLLNSFISLIVTLLIALLLKSGIIPLHPLMDAWS